MRRMLVALAGALILAGCTTTVTGRGGPGLAAPTGPGSSGGPTATEAPSGGGSATTGPGGYTPPKDGSGYSIQPTDQLMPLPGLLTRRGCDWMASAKSKLASLGVRKAAVSGSGCQFALAGGEIVQVHNIGPYTWVSDPPTYVKPASIAGLEARVYSYVDPKTDTICSARVNTRSLLALTVDGYNVKETGGSFQKHCQLAVEAATRLVKAYVPLAGGHPWPGTPQQPSPASLRGRTACTFVDRGAVIWANDVTDKSPKAGHSGTGSTCDYSSADLGRLHVLLTDGSAGLASVPPAAGTTVTSARAGIMPARFEDAGKTCTYSVQLGTRQVVQVSYTLGAKLDYAPYTQTVCLAAQSVVFDALVDTMSEQ